MSPGLTTLDYLGQRQSQARFLPEDKRVNRPTPKLGPRDELANSDILRDSVRREPRRLQRFSDPEGVQPPANLDQFAAATLRRGVTPDTGSTESPYRARLTGPVKFFNLLLAAWDLESESACVLLGFEPSESADVNAILRGYVPLRGRDVKDRIAHLFRIRVLLSTLFRNKSVENQWLREPRDILEGKAPMDLLLEGSMENLLLVREFVELSTGR